MTQYYYTDGKERYGPFSFEELREKSLSSETLVWKEGLVDWVPAKNISELQSLFSPPEINLIPSDTPFTPPYTYEMPPKNWLVESVLVTLLCCLPFGIVGIIHAVKVETLWNYGRREEALIASREAGKWTKIGFYIGLSAIVLTFLIMIISILLGVSSALPD